jgi:hypothetical protein
VSFNASEVLRRCKATLNDIGSVRWILSEQIDALNDALEAILIAKPDLFGTLINHSLVAGAKQTIPSDGYTVLDVAYNVSNAGVVGRAITKVKKATLDRQYPSWTLPNTDNDPTVRHWCQDLGERENFYVAPARPEGEAHKVGLRYAKRHATITAAEDSIDGIDEMKSAIYYFCMGRFLEKDEKFAGSKTAQYYNQRFAIMVQVRSIGEDDAEKVEQENEGS